MRSTLQAAMLVALSAFTAIAAADGMAPDEGHAVVAELAHRSAMPRAELESLLATCDSPEATQLALNLCAWRDQIASERRLARAVADRVQRLPQCKDAIEGKVEVWKQSLGERCKKAAAKDYAGGSAQPMAHAICMQAELDRMARRIGRGRVSGCTSK